MFVFFISREFKLLPTNQIQNDCDFYLNLSVLQPFSISHTQNTLDLNDMNIILHLSPKDKLGDCFQAFAVTYTVAINRTLLASFNCFSNLSLGNF